MMTPHDQQNKLTNTIKQTSEELLNCRLNIITSTDGHVHVTIEEFFKKQRSNYSTYQSNIKDNDGGKE